MTPNVLYLLLDRPWRWRVILRAWRVHRIRKEASEHDLVQWASSLTFPPHMPEWQRQQVRDRALRYPWQADQIYGQYRDWRNW